MRVLRLNLKLHLLILIRPSACSRLFMQRPSANCRHPSIEAGQNDRLSTSSSVAVSRVQNKGEPDSRRSMNAITRTTFAVVLSVVIAAGSIMNLLVLIVVCRNKAIRQHIASVFIGNLAIIDFLNLVFVMPFSLEIVIYGKWLHSNTLCQVNGLFGTLFSFASILTLAVISLDRWGAVMKPLVYRARMTVTHAVQMAAYVWVQATVFAIVPACKNWFVVNVRYSYCGFPSVQYTKTFMAYMWVSIVMNIGLSLIVILVTYFYVFRVARSHSRRIAVAVISVFASEHRKLRKETFRQREARTAIKISFVIGAFLICHLPYSILRVMELVGNTSVLSLSPALLVSMKWTVYLKSAVNPFIYSLLQKRFRTALIELLGRSRRESNLNATVIYTSKNQMLRESQSAQVGAVAGTRSSK